jgi:tetratricopeptide (TPR) repeat protein
MRAFDVYRGLGESDAGTVALQRRASAKERFAVFVDLDEAIKHVMRAFDVYRGLGESDAGTAALQRRASAKERFAVFVDLDEAIKHAMRAFDVYPGLRESDAGTTALQQGANSRARFAEFLQKAKLHAEAIKHIERAIIDFAALSMTAEGAMALSNLGNWRETGGDFASARDALAKALDLYGQVGDLRALVVTGRRLGQLFEADHMNKQARRCYDDTLTRVEEDIRKRYGTEERIDIDLRTEIEKLRREARDLAVRMKRESPVG